MDEYTIVSGKTNKTGIFALKEQGIMVYQKIGLLILILRGVFFLIGRIYKGQVKFSPYTQYTSIFINP